jgi:sodium pump decarboxylase gamma subunit
MLSIVGMGLTFMALGILILVMVLLDRFFKDDKKVESAEAIPAERAIVDTSARETAEEEVVAAIAAALAHLRSLEICEAGLGSTLATPPNRWWLMGRAQQSPADALRINHWRKQ